MIFKKLTFTILAVSLAASLEAKSPYESTYVERNPYVMQLLQKAGISVNFRSRKTFQDYVFEAKRNHRVKPHVMREIEDVYKSFYIVGKEAPTSKRELEKRDSFDRQNTEPVGFGVKIDSDEFDDFKRQGTEPRRFSYKDDFDRQDTEPAVFRHQKDPLGKVDEAIALLQEIRKDLDLSKG